MRVFSKRNNQNVLTPAQILSFQFEKKTIAYFCYVDKLCAYTAQTVVLKPIP